MALTFKSLSQHADFDAASPAEIDPRPEKTAAPQELSPTKIRATDEPTVSLGGLVYNVQLILPADRDPAVYDALFKSLKEHLLK